MTRPQHQAGDDAWRAFVARHATGGELTADVVSVVPFGAFVEIDGVHGLLHVSEYPAGAAPSVGDRVRVRLAAIDEDNRRFSVVTV